MKAILLSVQPKWLEKILNGEKTIEIRKTMPKCDLPIEVCIYCTKGKELYNCCGQIFGDEVFDSVERVNTETEHLGSFYGKPIWKLNGAVVAKFTLREVSKIEIISNDVFHLMPPSNGRFLVDSCLTQQQVHDYLANKNGYAWHISDLQVFNKPKELREFYKPCKYISKKDICTHHKHFGGCPCDSERVIRPPQSWQYVEYLKTQEGK